MIGHKCDGCRYKGEHVEMGFKPFGVCYKETNLIKAEENYKAETCPYLPQLYETEPEPLPEDEPWPKENPYIIMTPDLKEAVKNYGEAMERAKERLAEILTPIIRAFAARVAPICKEISAALPFIFKTCVDVIEQIIDLYPNKRVIHLAKHGKRRTRKKNINRIKKYFEREAKKRPVFAQN